MRKLIFILLCLICIFGAMLIAGDYVAVSVSAGSGDVRPVSATMKFYDLVATNSFSLEEAALVSNYVWVAANAFRAPGAQPATLVTRGAGIAYEFADNLAKDVRANIRIPAAIDHARDINICVGWDTATTSQTCHWEVVYLVTSLNESVLATATTVTNLAVSSATANGLTVTPVVAVDTSSGDVCLHLTLTRDGSAADDTIGASVYLEGIAVQYTQNAVGDE